MGKRKSKCKHEFTKDMTNEIANFLEKYNGSKGRRDRSFYLSFYRDGDMTLEEADDSGGGHEFTILNVNYCPACGKRISPLSPAT